MAESSGKKRIKETGNFTVNTDVPYSIGNITLSKKRDLIIFFIGCILLIFAAFMFIPVLFFNINVPIFLGITIASFGFGYMFLSFTDAVRFKKTIRILCAMLAVTGIAIVAIVAETPEIDNFEIADEAVINIPQTVPDSLYINSSKPKPKISAPNTFLRGETATISHLGKPYTSYSISVYYSSSASTAKGLERKTSDSNGIVSWSWNISKNTKPGGYRLVIEGGGEEIEKYFIIK